MGCTGKVLGIAKSGNHRRALFASLAALAGIAAFASTSSTHAGVTDVTCQFDAATHELTVTLHRDDANGRVVRDGDDLVVEDVFGAAVGCAGTPDPTRFNTDLVYVRGQGASVDDLQFDLDLRGGPFAPGFSAEGDDSSEIEFLLAFPAGSASMAPIYGRRQPDRIVLGRLVHGQGANLNAAEEVDDPDVTIRRGRFLVGGFGGADVISGRGGPGFVGGYRRSVLAIGLRGDDVLIGGPKRDYLIGGRGHDTMKGGRGGDAILSARDDTRDRVRCGPGSDSAEVDRKDRVRGCERVS